MLFVCSLDVCDLCLPPTKRNPPQQQGVVGGDPQPCGPAEVGTAPAISGQVWAGGSLRGTCQPNFVVRKAEASLKVVYASCGRLSRS